MITRKVQLKSLLLILLAASLCRTQSLKIVTVNLWTGLDYHGTLAIGAYESPEVREKRLSAVEQMLLSVHPDVVALQEVNPAARIARRFAESCDYDVVYQRVNSGLKIGSFGIPWNLNEGVAILARKELMLQFVDVWSLSDSPGIIGNSCSLHSDEHDIGLVCTINVRGVPIVLVNVHTISVVPVDAENSANLGRIVESDPELSLRREKLFAEYSHRAGDIRQELIELSDHISTVKLGTPLIVLGDFNTTVNSVEMKEFLRATKLFDAAASAGEGNIVTWDAERNTNTRFSRASVDARGSRLSPLELLSASYDDRSRRIDHVFLSRAFEDNDVKSVKTVLDTPQTGLFASDHYGILAELSIGRLLSVQPTVSDSVEQVEGSTVEPFPILSYDTDVGFGYGAKLFLLNSFGRNESFDAVLFNSTKGERWYRFVFSLPDFEVRQGKIYPIAVDLAVDYDKYLKNSFFGVGNGSKFEDREYYTREPLE
ncbi:MAG TPA: endonuclease/exonuclease/phosphatase family protein, partial [Bacteroidota bacterium]